MSWLKLKTLDGIWSNVVLLGKVGLLSMWFLICISGCDCSGSSYGSPLSLLHKPCWGSQMILTSDLLQLNTGILLQLQGANQWKHHFWATGKKFSLRPPSILYVKASLDLKSNILHLTGKCFVLWLCVTWWLKENKRFILWSENEGADRWASNKSSVSDTSERW